MNKLIAIVIATVCTLFYCTTYSFAQGTLPRIGVRKWTIDSLRGNLSTAVAYARNADRLFVGTWVGSVLVVDTKAGRIIDTIKTSDYPGIWNQIKNSPQQIVSDLATTYDGRLIVFGIEYISTTIMVEYPSKRLLDSAEMGLGNNAHRMPQWLYVSPKGTFVAMQDVLINRKNGMQWQIPYQKSRISFDTAETVAAYNTVSTYGGISYTQFVALQYLDDTTRAPIQTNLWGTPTLSADGTKLMTAGAAWAVNSKLPGLRAKAVVMNIADSRILWQIYGDDDSPDQIDFERFAWNSNGTLFYGRRHSASLPSDERNRLYRWDVGSNAPNAIVDDRLVCGYGFQPIFNDDMSEAYTCRGESKGPIYAVEFSNTGTTVPYSGLTGSDTIYPNPTNGSVTVRWEWPDEAVHWQAISPTGQLVDYGSAAQDGNAVHIILANDLATGQYTLLVRDALARHVQRFTVVKI